MDKPDYQDESTEDAKKLQVSNWGSPEEVGRMSKMIRNVQSREEARSILKKIKEKGALENKYNKELRPTLSRESINEHVSGKAGRKSISHEAQWNAAANIDQLYKNAIEPKEYTLDQTKDNQGLEERRYLYSPMDYGGRTVPVKMTIKKYKRPEDGTRLFASEVIDHDLNKKTGVLVNNRDGMIEDSTSLSQPARHPVTSSIAQIPPEVKRENDNFTKAHIKTLFKHYYPDIKGENDRNLHRMEPMSRV